VQPGTIDLTLLILIFIGLQAWWIIPIIKKNNDLNERGGDIKEEIKRLERIYKNYKWETKSLQKLKTTETKILLFSDNLKSLSIFGLKQLWT